MDQKLSHSLLYTSYVLYIIKNKQPLRINTSSLMKLINKCGAEINMEGVGLEKIQKLTNGGLFGTYYAAILACLILQIYDAMYECMKHLMSS